MNGTCTYSLAHVMAGGRLKSGDLLLYRRRGLRGRVIAAAGRGIHCHAAKVVFWGGWAYLIEVREWRGGRIVLLERELRRRRATVDVYSPNAGMRWPRYMAWEALDVMRRLAGCPYGWRNIFWAGLVHLPLARLLVTASMDDASSDRRPPYCSQAIAWAERVGGHVDVVPGLADRLTEPADLARSQFYEYRFTIRGAKR